MTLSYAVILRGSVLLRPIVAGVGRRLAHQHVVHVPAVRTSDGSHLVRLAGDGLERHPEGLVARGAFVAVAAGTRRGRGGGARRRGRARGRGGSRSRSAAGRRGGSGGRCGRARRGGRRSGGARG